MTSNNSMSIVKKSMTSIWKVIEDKDFRFQRLFVRAATIGCFLIAVLVVATTGFEPSQGAPGVKVFALPAVLVAFQVILHPRVLARAFSPPRR